VSDDRHHRVRLFDTDGDLVGTQTTTAFTRDGDTLTNTAEISFGALSNDTRMASVAVLSGEVFRKAELDTVEYVAAESKAVFRAGDLEVVVRE